MTRRNTAKLMASYLGGFLVPGIALFFMNVSWQTQSGFIQAAFYAYVVMPMLSAWVVANVLHRLRNRRTFLSEHSSPFALFIRGLGAALGVFALWGVIAIVTSQDLRLDILTAALTVPCVWLSLRERATGFEGLRCKHCRYDLRGSLAAGRCPECGTSFEPLAAGGIVRLTPVSETV